MLGCLGLVDVVTEVSIGEYVHGRVQYLLGVLAGEIQDVSARARIGE